SVVMKGCGIACRLLLAKEILALRCFRRTRVQNRHRQLAAISECFILLFARTGKIFSPRSANYKSAESNSSSKITKSRTRFILAIPMATNSKSRPTIWDRTAHLLLYLISREVETSLEIPATQGQKT